MHYTVGYCLQKNPFLQIGMCLQAERHESIKTLLHERITKKSFGYLTNIPV